MDTRSLILKKKEELATPSSKAHAPRLALRVQKALYLLGEPLHNATTVSLIQGCTPITASRKEQEAEEFSYRYEINLGQHIHMSGPVNWTLTLECASTEASSTLEYKIYSLKDNDKTWMVACLICFQLKWLDFHALADYWTQQRYPVAIGRASASDVDLCNRQGRLLLYIPPHPES